MKLKNLLTFAILLYSFQLEAGPIKSKTFDIDEDAERLEQRVEQLQREIRTLSAKQEKLEKIIAELLDRVDSRSQEPRAEAKADKAVNNENEDEAPAKSASKSGSTSEEKLQDKSPEKPATPTTNTVANGSEKKDYDIALAALKSNDLALAAKKFDSFVSRFPKSSLVSNAHFWHGEACFKQKQYDQSALQYLKSYKAAPKGPKAWESLLKLATSLSELKKNSEACGILSKLDAEFPAKNDANLKKINGLRAKLKCK